MKRYLIVSLTFLILAFAISLGHPLIAVLTPDQPPTLLTHLGNHALFYGLILAYLIGSIAILTSRRSKPAAIPSPLPQADPTPPAIPEIPTPTPELSSKPKELSSTEKGDRFEHHIVTFIKQSDPSRNLIFAEWRGDKYNKAFHIYAQSTRKPDLEYIGRNTGRKLVIECKWRNNWITNSHGSTCLLIADDDKMKEYKDYCRESNITGIVAIGIGWKESPENKPNEIYFMSLDHLHNGEIEYGYMKRNHIPLESLIADI